MKRLLIAALTVLLLGAAVPVQPPSFVEEIALDGVTVADVAVAVFRDVEGAPYTLAPEVYGDKRLVSVRLSGPMPDLHKAAVRFFDAMGFAVDQRGGVWIVGPKPEPKVPDEPRFNVVYRPQYREVAYLMDQIRPLIPGGRFSGDRGVKSPMSSPIATTTTATGTAMSNPGGLSSAPSSMQVSAVTPTSALGQIDRTYDTMVFNGTKAECDLLRDLLPQLDVPEGDLVVRATVYEVTTDRSDGSALQLAAKVLGGRLNVQFGPASAIGNAVSVNVGGIDAVLSALDQDNRFKSLSSPVAHARSGTTAQFTSGQDVPVLGAVSYAGPAGATPVQSVQYRSSGVIFKVTPTLRQRVIAIDVDQELSNFVATTTGVNDSPTLVKRAMTSSLSVQSGDVVLLGGLTEDKRSDAKQGLFVLPDWLNSKTADDARTEIILVLQVSEGPAAPVAGAHLVGLR